MLETIGIIILVVVGVVIVAVLTVGGWLTVSVLRLIGRGVSALVGGGSPRRPALSGPVGRRCPRPKCHTENIATAHYCRRCGTALDAHAYRAAAARTSAW